MAAPQEGCLDTIIKSFFGVIVTVVMIVAVVAVFVHG